MNVIVICQMSVLFVISAAFLEFVEKFVKKFKYIKYIIKMGESGDFNISIEVSPRSFANLQSDSQQLQYLFPQSQNIIVAERNSEASTSQAIERESTTAGGSNQQVFREEDFFTPLEDLKTVWVESSTKLLLSLVAEMKPKVGKCSRLRTKKKMWMEVQKKMDNAGHNYSITQIENKYRSLERRFKDVKANNNKTGRDRHTCPFEKELAEILSDNASVNPEHLLGDEEIEAAEVDDNAIDANTSTLSSGSTSSSSTKIKGRRDCLAEQLKVLNEERKKEVLETKKFQEQVLETIKEAAERKERLLAEKNELLRSILQSINK